MHTAPADGSQLCRVKKNLRPEEYILDDSVSIKSRESEVIYSDGEQISGCLRIRECGERGRGGPSGGDGHIHYPDYRDGFTVVYVCRNASTRTLRRSAIRCVSFIPQ